MFFIVICLDDDGRYVQTTRKKFLTMEDAIHYKNGIDVGRKPIIVTIIGSPDE